MVSTMRPFLVVVAAILAAPACIIAEPAPDPIGSFAFNWSFAGETDCARAGVSDLDVVVSQDGEVVIDDRAEPCFGGGLKITEIDSGPYDVDIIAYDSNGDPQYEVSFEADVPVDHAVNDLGTIELAALDPPPPPPSEGTLGFFWQFLYPTDGQAVQDCALAGVDSVDVTVTPQGAAGEAFTQSSSCDAAHQGLNIDNLNEGRYTLRLTAHGTFQGGDVTLYDSGDIVADVVADQTTDLGNVDLGRVAANFSDFDVSWVFADGSSCGAGEQVTLSFERDGLGAPEDSFAVDCGAADVVRRTFVPGHYTVTGVAGDYSASVPVDLAPNSVAQIDLSLAR